MFDTKVDMSCVLMSWPVLLGTLLRERFIKGVGHEEDSSKRRDCSSQSETSCEKERLEVHSPSCVEHTKKPPA